MMPGMKQQVKEKLMLFQLRHSRFFDEKWYREQTGIPAGIDAAAHYLRGGWREHDPSPSFRQADYLAANEDVRRADICPLAHWLFYGKRQHYPLYPGYAENHYHTYRLPRALLRGLAETVFFRMRKRNQGIRLLVFMHIRYPEAADEMLEYLKNLRAYPYDLVVTATQGTDIKTVRQKVLRFRTDAEFRVCPDRGDDVLPFLAGLKEHDTESYDLIVKMNSICCDSRRGRLEEGTYFCGRDRFLCLFRAILGPRWVHRNIDRLMRDRETDLIAARRMIRTDTPRKEKLTGRALAAMDLSLETGYTWVAGGVMMMNAACAKPLKQVQLCAEDPDLCMPGALSAADALERYISGCVSAERKHGNSVCRIRRCISRIRFGADLYPDKGTQSVETLYRETGNGELKTAAFAVTETGENAVAGDYFTALELAEALEAKGWRTKFLARKELGDGWYCVGQETDVLISLLEDYDPRQIFSNGPGLVTVGWARNWFDRWAKNPGAGAYDILLASSEAGCRELEERLKRKVELFPIAANAGRFRNDPDGESRREYLCDICFTGNRFGPREIEEELVPAELPYRVRIYGNGWEKVKAFAPYSCGHLPYAEIPEVYRGAKIVLDDATASTRETGSVNSRVFDALAAGCLVLTNNAVGAAETFEGMLPVFRNREELKTLLKQYLEDEGARREKVRELNAFVLQKHTYEVRAEKLTEMIRMRQAEEA